MPSSWPRAIPRTSSQPECYHRAIIERTGSGRRALLGGNDCSPTTKLGIAVLGVVVGGAAQYVVRRLWIEPWVSDVLEDREIAEVVEDAGEPDIGLFSR